AKKLIQIRKHRLRMVKQNEKTDYVDIKTVSEEIDHACRFFEKHKWPVIDVTRISIEEIAATILQMYSHRLKKLC
ncbi:MAG TPA: kinase/pyrophosphorylase, partial [Rhodospirillales bacterium]|nr:kinase/pyrophosphorylase [Rhodospirillales bacterium]